MEKCKTNITVISLVICGYKILSLSLRGEQESKELKKKLLGTEYIWNYGGRRERKQKNIQ
jgi:hypothetical protein